jgi:putative NADH-flavin reductase
MRLAILGATGRTGRYLAAWALENGHVVSALARDPDQLSLTAPGGERNAAVRAAPPGGPGHRNPQETERSPGPALKVTRGDALDSAAVASVIDGADAVFSALGPRGAKTPGLLTGAAANITGAMGKTGASRLICLSAAGAYISGDPNMNWLVKAILPRVLAGQFADVRGMEDVVRNTDLDWTLVRATRLVNSPGSGRYRVSPDYPPPGGGKISRADVAHFMASVLTDGSWVRSAPALSY